MSGRREAGPPAGCVGRPGDRLSRWARPRKDTVMPKALVVDDSRAMRRILARNMQEAGFEVCEAANGHDALAQLRSSAGEISLILVDWNMPEMNGLEFVKQVRADPSFAGTRLMMVTTETEMERMVAALEAGADEYVMKPFTKEILFDKLRLLGAIR